MFPSRQNQVLEGTMSLKRDFALPACNPIIEGRFLIDGYKLTPCAHLNEAIVKAFDNRDY